MATIPKIAKKYAEALAEIKLDESLITELEQVSAIFNDQLYKVIMNPSLKLAQRLALIENCFANSVQKETLQLLMLLVKRRRISVAKHLGGAYRLAYNSAKGILRAELNSARSLDENSISNIKKQLEQIFSKNIEINQKEDPSLIAGHRIQVEGKVIDTSLKSKLKDLRACLKT